VVDANSREEPRGARSVEGRMFKVVDPNSSIYVELSVSGVAHVAEFPPGEERAFVVGSTERASLRVNGVGVAPVQFHLEREDDVIWLIPAYGIADLSVNAISVLGPTPLAERSVVEFCDVRVYAAIREADPLSANDDRFATLDIGAQAARESYSLRLPGENDSTVLAMRPVRPSAAPGRSSIIEATEDDVEFRRSQSLSHSNERGAIGATDQPSHADNSTAHQQYQDMQRLLPDQHSFEQPTEATPDFTLYGTQIMPAYRPLPQPIPEFSSECRGLGGQETHEPQHLKEARRPASTVQIGLSQTARSPRFVPPPPTATKAPEERANVNPSAIREAVTPPPLGRHPLALATSGDDSVLPDSRLQRGRVSERAPGIAKSPSPLARLGMLTRARPLLVGCFTGVGAALLVILLLAVTRLTEVHPLPTATQPGPVLANLNSLCPAPLPAAATQPPTPPQVPPAPAELPQAHAVPASRAPVQTRRPADEPKKPDESVLSKALY